MTILLSRRLVLAIALVCSLVILVGAGGSADAQEAVVHGVLIYDPSCENCEFVLNEVLPPLEARYGEQLDIVKVDASTVTGFDLWTAGTKAYQVPSEKKGVPLLFLGDRALSGQTEIAEQLPAAIEAGFAAGGVPLPEALGLTEADRIGWAAHYGAPVSSRTKVDPTAYGLAFVVLAGALAGLVFATAGILRSRPLSVRRLSERVHIARSTAIPLLAVAGLLVAGYLSYLHLSRSEAICPIGNCDSVQHSSWSYLFGVPVAYFGFLTYGAILGLWLWARFGSGRSERLSGALVLGIAAFGTAFSAYLTVLELFVIRAVCMWCLASALVMTLLMVATAVPLLQTGLLTAVGQTAAHPRVRRVRGSASG